MEWNFPLEIAFTSLLKRGANFLGQFISNLSYFKVVAAWLTLCTILFGGILLLLSPGIGFVNAAFMATSAWGGTGLYSVEGSNVSSAGFILLYLLMYCGGTCTLLLPPMIFRRVSYSKLRPELLEFSRSEAQSTRPITKSLIEVTNQCEIIHRALAMSILLVLMHIFFWLFFGTLIMYGINTMYDDPPELTERGFSKFWASTYLTTTSFFNCGLVLTSDSLLHYVDKPGIYVWCSVIILAGNTCAPACLRLLLHALHASAPVLGLDRPALRFAGPPSKAV